MYIDSDLEFVSWNGWEYGGYVESEKKSEQTLVEK